MPGIAVIARVLAGLVLVLSGRADNTQLSPPRVRRISTSIAINTVLVSLAADSDGISPGRTLHTISSRGEPGTTVAVRSGRAADAVTSRVAA